ncbi:ThiF family adenylyltransferase [Actinoplanes derwentensis]|uniref:ThiF family protein n=1 Tax=Actinoplanes derwentensis TaxID=113562 RepID=A0A1H2DCP2_9ACTN|nr:ThiF family adenylyltransferase [Actinoplanes derwentensis]GID90480.1 hypothetical protein Ade03nite_94040 [Actinoplanes derwentensis]SDT80359.1 ThiF family protein [Actinoplanes derwentensis]
MTQAWNRGLTAERDRFRRVLAVAGFTGDGATVRGPLRWYPSDGVAATATIEITLTAAWPFGPPQIRVIDAGIPLTPTFHQNHDGSLCLWPAETPVEKAPWREPALLLSKVAGWLHQTEAGWPDDTACDLERYLAADPLLLLLYDMSSLTITRGCVRTRTETDGRGVTVTDEKRQPPTQPRRRKAGGKPGNAPTPGRRYRRLAWIADIGEIGTPIRDWASLYPLLGADAAEIAHLISIGSVEFLVLHYRRSGASGVLALTVRPPSSLGATIEVRACESADTSTTTRMLRADPAAHDLGVHRVAVVGVGAVGSFVADLLFRHGVQNLTLLDGQLLRPGNLVRHLAGNSWVGYPKTLAVKGKLSTIGLDTTHVEPRHATLTTPEQAIALLREHDLVVDASADPRATALLAWASDIAGRPVVSVCVERHGGIIRVDRFPLRGAERHHPPVRARGEATGAEHGCDDPVSLTPPTSVVAAAELACRATIDELTTRHTMPATLLEIIEPQETPYDVRGLKPIQRVPGLPRALRRIA